MIKYKDNDSYEEMVNLEYIFRIVKWTAGYGEEESFEIMFFPYSDEEFTWDFSTRERRDDMYDAILLKSDLFVPPHIRNI